MNTLKEIRYGRGKSGDGINNQEFITLYLAMHGPKSRAEVRRELTQWKGVPSTWYKFYLYGPNGNIGFSLIRDDCVLTGRGIRQALNTSKKVGIPLDTTILLDHLTKHLDFVVGDPLTRAALNRDLRPDRLLELVEWDITNNYPYNRRRFQ